MLVLNNFSFFRKKKNIFFKVCAGWCGVRQRVMETLQTTRRKRETEYLCYAVNSNNVVEEGASSHRAKRYESQQLSGEP